MLLSIHCRGGPGGRAAVRFVSIRKPTLQGIVAEFVMKSLNLNITNSVGSSNVSHESQGHWSCNHSTFLFNIKVFAQRLLNFFSERDYLALKSHIDTYDIMTRSQREMPVLSDTGYVGICIMKVQ